MTDFTISDGGDPILSGVLLTDFSKCFIDWWIFFSVGPGPIALTLIFGAKDFARIMVAVYSADLEIL